ncbi:MAG: V-type ATPase subunit [Oscillospiraceae bacterium]|jgi:V/A-type H+-transporting ATPase subunit C|nr:V-type ATPase subunit [Oscillospiraceae bacterium]
MFFSSNAMLVKARAMDAGRLRAKDYEKLLSCSSVVQIAQILKNLKSYSYIIGFLEEKEVHRAILESALREELFDEFDILAKYDLALGEKLFKYIMTKLEVAQLSRFLIFLFAKNTENYIFFNSKFLKKHTSIDFENLKKIKDPKDFLNIISKFIGAKKDDIIELDINIMETRLYIYLFKEIFNVASNLNKSAKREIEEFYKEYIDFLNFSRIFRLSKFYNIEPKEAKKFLFLMGNININKFVNMPQNLEFKEIFKRSRFLKYFKPQNMENFDTIPRLIKYKWARHKIKYSLSPSIVTISYIFLKEIEILNIVNIIEGVRYGLEHQKIQSLLII